MKLSTIFTVALLPLAALADEDTTKLTATTYITKTVTLKRVASATQTVTGNGTMTSYGSGPSATASGAAATTTAGSSGAWAQSPQLAFAGMAGAIVVALM